SSAMPPSCGRTVAPVLFMMGTPVTEPSNIPLSPPTNRNNVVAADMRLSCQPRCPKMTRDRAWIFGNRRPECTPPLRVSVVSRHRGDHDAPAARDSRLGDADGGAMPRDARALPGDACGQRGDLGGQRCVG